jgi:hypothetical protein
LNNEARLKVGHVALCVMSFKGSEGGCFSLPKCAL